MIFYDCSTAPSPRRARMLIVEKGINVETKEISIARGEQLQPDFLAVNPRATVPVLVTETGTVLTENTGIAAYLEAYQPDPPMMGRDADEKGLVMMWNAIAETQGGLPIAEALRNGNPRMQGRAVTGVTDYQQIPALAERGFARARAFFEILEDRLKDSPYLAGDSLTYADITAYVLVDFSRVIKLQIPDANTATQDWFERISQRPSASA